MHNPPVTKVRWKERQIASTKRDVKAELDLVDHGRPTRQRLQTAILRANALEGDLSPSGQLRRFIYIMSALVHHERHGGLSAHQVCRAADLANAILLSNGVYPGQSKSALLHGELHLVLSQVHRQAGRQLSAAWEQQMALYSAPTALPGGRAFQSLAMANRALRLGHVKLAIREYLAAENGDLSLEAWQKARLGRVKSMRLSQDPAAENLVAATKASCSLSAAAAAELDWEAICLAASRTQDLAPMLLAVRKGQPHYQATYLLEAKLWALATRSRDWLDRLPSMNNLSRRHDLKVPGAGFLPKIVRQIELCYDFAVPLAIRIRDLGSTLVSPSLVTTVDKELLMWAAAARFLARSSSFDLAALVLSEYTALSLRLSDGNSKDVLRIVDDMLARAWFDDVHASFDAAD